MLDFRPTLTPGDTLDHHGPYIRERFSYQGYTADGLVRERLLSQRQSAHPFGTGSGLPSSSATKNQPRRPRLTVRCLIGRQLVISCPDLPIVKYELQFLAGQSEEKFIQCPCVYRVEQGVPQGLRGGVPHQLLLCPTGLRLFAPAHRHCYWSGLGYRVL